MNLEKDPYFIQLDDRVEGILTVSRWRGTTAFGKKGLKEALVETGPLDNLNHMPKSRIQLALLLGAEKKEAAKVWKAEMDRLLEGDADGYSTLALVLKKVDHDEALMSRLQPIIEDFRKRTGIW